MNRIGKFIVIEGIDQSGKKTQVDYLAARLSSNGYKSKIISFPIYTTAIGKEIEKSLSGKVDYPVEVRHLLLSANRWEMRSQIEESLLLDMFLICNRYYESNIVYGMANGLEESWLKNLDKGLPKADLTILINIPASESRKRKTRDRDIHENNLGLLAKVSSLYQRIARESGWDIVDGTGDVGQISLKIWESVRRFYKLP
ncbi:MAG: dTMP kinase [Nitrososphaerales archaeon]